MCSAPKGGVLGVNSLPLDVLALSHLQCLPQRHCIMLHLHRIASALPLQDWPRRSLPPLSSLALFYISFSSLVIPLSSVRLVPISGGLAASCCADGAGHGSVGLQQQQQQQ